MTPVDETILTRVEALLAKAGSTEHEAERDAFIEGARRLMAKYSIDESMLRERADRETPAHDLWTYTPDADKLRGKHAILMLSCEIAGSGTSAAMFPLTDEGPQLCLLIGFPTAIAVTKVLYANLLVQALHEAWLAGWTEPGRIEAFYVGFAYGAVAKLRVNQAVQEVEEPGMGLVLADRASEIDRMFDELGVAREGSIDFDDSAATAAGFQAGTQVDVGNQNRLDSAPETP